MNIVATGIILLSLGQGGASPAQVAANLGEGRFAGWQMAHDIIGPKLLPEDGTKDQYPGLVQFAADVEKIAKTLNFQGDPKTFPGINCDALVTKNPNFWRANYEVAPGDPAWMSLHAGLLLAGGEATRAQTILLLAKSRPGVPQGMIQGIDHLLAHCGRLIADGDAAVGRGITVFDKGDHPAAMKIYEEALKQWPQNGWAHYEIGFTRMQDRMTAKGIESKPVGTNPLAHTPEILASFEKARWHSPFQVPAYQGAGENIAERIQAIIRARGSFTTMAKGGPEKPITLDAMLAFSKDLQTAEQDELALVARQVAVIRRGTFKPEDHPFLTKSLRCLVPGKETDAVLERMMGKALALRQLMPLEPDKAK